MKGDVAKTTSSLMGKTSVLKKYTSLKTFYRITIGAQRRGPLIRARESRKVLQRDDVWAAF